MNHNHLPVTHASRWSILLRSRTGMLCAHLCAWALWRSITHVTPDYLGRWTVAYAGLAVVATAVLNRRMTAWLVTQFAVAGVWSGSLLKERLLDQPLLAHDVVFFIRNTAHNTELLTAYPRYAAAGGIALILAVLATVCAWRSERSLVARSPAPVLRRILLAIAALCVVSEAWSLTFGHNARARGQHILRAEADGFTHEVWFVQMRRFNALPRFLESFWEFEVPVIRDAEQASRFCQMMPAHGPARSVAAKPDILLVLRESHAALMQLWDHDSAPTPADACAAGPRALGGNGVATRHWAGALRVHTFGGGTWLTEFSVLSGFSWADFGNAGSYAPFTLAPRMHECLPVQMRRLGYRTVEFHAEQATFLNCGPASEGYGFETFWSARDVGLSGDWRKLTDGEIYRAVLAKLKATDDGRPVFALVLTICNHGPHDRKRVHAPIALPPDWPPNIAGPVADYLDRQAQTNRDFASLREQWLGAGSPRLLVGFGDHWPSLEGAVVQLAQAHVRSGDWRQQLFRTPVQFDANYPLVSPPSHETLDVTYLGGAILDAAGLEAGPFFAANEWLREHCDARYLEAADQPLLRGYLTWARLVEHAWE